MPVCCCVASVVGCAIAAAPAAGETANTLLATEQATAAVQATPGIAAVNEPNSDDTFMVVLR